MGVISNKLIGWYSLFNNLNGILKEVMFGLQENVTLESRQNMYYQYSVTVQQWMDEPTSDLAWEDQFDGQ